MSYASNGGQESGIFKTANLLGKAFGWLAGILAFPQIHALVISTFTNYLHANYSANTADFFLWVITGIGVVICYGAVTVAVTTVLVMLMASLVGRL
ncbi:MAG TPA: hypothetical protein VE907_04405 [Gammaproteobacteria bacterium]|nr:hypothetical protein [Gammaproteobacteria bacterium]